MYLERQNFFAGTAFSNQKYGNIRRSNIGNDPFQSADCGVKASHKRNYLERNGDHSQGCCVLLDLRGHTTSYSYYG